MNDLCICGTCGSQFTDWKEFFNHKQMGCSPKNKNKSLQSAVRSFKEVSSPLLVDSSSSNVSVETLLTTELESSGSNAHVPLSTFVPGVGT